MLRITRKKLTIPLSAAQQSLIRSKENYGGDFHVLKGKISSSFSDKDAASYIAKTAHDPQTQTALATISASSGCPKSYYTTAAISTNKSTIQLKQQKWKECLLETIFNEKNKSMRRIFLEKIGARDELTNVPKFIDIIIKKLTEGHSIRKIFKENISDHGGLISVSLVPNWSKLLDDINVSTIVNKSEERQIFRTKGSFLARDEGDVSYQEFEPNWPEFVAEDFDLPPTSPPKKRASEDLSLTGDHTTAMPVHKAMRPSPSVRRLGSAFSSGSYCFWKKSVDEKEQLIDLSKCGDSWFEDCPLLKLRHDVEFNDNQVCLKGQFLKIIDVDLEDTVQFRVLRDDNNIDLLEAVAFLVPVGTGVVKGSK
jgi:hypothetical protein